MDSPVSSKRPVSYKPVSGFNHFSFAKQLPALQKHFCALVNGTKSLSPEILSSAYTLPPPPFPSISPLHHSYWRNGGMLTGWLSPHNHPACLGLLKIHVIQEPSSRGCTVLKSELWPAIEKLCYDLFQNVFPLAVSMFKHVDYLTCMQLSLESFTYSPVHIGIINSQRMHWESLRIISKE